jgi:hypothetical protein
MLRRAVAELARSRPTHDAAVGRDRNAWLRPAAIVAIDLSPPTRPGTSCLRPRHPSTDPHSLRRIDRDETALMTVESLTTMAKPLAR